LATSITKCNTIQDLIDYGKSLDISHDKLHFKAKIENTDGSVTIINYTSILDKYMDYLLPVTKVVTLNDQEYAKYKFQPKLLSFEMYGTTELWSLILRINNLTSAAQFTLKTLKLFTTDVFEILNEIIILEGDEINKNRTENGL
jgi:hypothetical protein